MISTSNIVERPKGIWHRAGTSDIHLIRRFTVIFNQKVMHVALVVAHRLNVSEHAESGICYVVPFRQLQVRIPVTIFLPNSRQE